MDIYYQIFKEQNLLIQKYTGIWSTNIYKSFSNKIRNNPNFKYVKKVLTDFREVNLEPSFLDIDELISFRNDKIKSKHNNAMIINTPENTVAAHLYQDTLKKLGHNYIYCSTNEKAISFLGLEKDRTKINDIMTDFKSHSIKFH